MRDYEQTVRELRDPHFVYHFSRDYLKNMMDDAADAIEELCEQIEGKYVPMCKHRTAHGLCLLYTDAECTSWCVDGPCSDEEIAEPGFQLDEWCEDCKEYDKERHWCPRFNRVIHEVAKRLEEEKK